jgi:hypothetical protein
MQDPITAQITSMPDSVPLITNDPNPLTIAIYVGGFLVAFVWNLVAYYKLFTLEHVKREMEIKRKLRLLGLLSPDED